MWARGQSTFAPESLIAFAHSGCSLAIVQRVLAGDFKAGYQTPSLAYGADFVLSFAGVKHEDLDA